MYERFSTRSRGVQENLMSATFVGLEPGL